MQLFYLKYFQSFISPALWIFYTRLLPPCPPPQEFRASSTATRPHRSSAAACTRALRRGCPRASWRLGSELYDQWSGLPRWRWATTRGSSGYSQSDRRKGRSSRSRPDLNGFEAAGTGRTWEGKRSRWGILVAPPSSHELTDGSGCGSGAAHLESGRRRADLRVRAPARATSVPVVIGG